MLRFLGRGKKTSEFGWRRRGGLGPTWLEAYFRRSHVDAEFWEDLEEALIVADVGVETSMQLVEKVQDEARWRGARTPDAVYDLLRARNLGIVE